MKECPKCKAKIQDEARFCLYCMTSFEQKQNLSLPVVTKPRWPYGVVAVLVLVLIAAGFLLFLGQSAPTNAPAVTTTQSVVGTTSTTLPATTTNTTTVQPSVLASTQNATTTTVTSTAATTTTTMPTTTTTTPTTTAPTATYLYRDAQYGDDFAVNANLENAVVIIGVKTAAENGEYHIPETLDGKCVVAIAPLAFCDEHIRHTVKTVVVPSSVKTIWNNAFASCYNLTDIFFKGNAVYTESQAFAPSAKRSGTLTIHCAANCHDRNFRYYKDSASNYDATYKEWNG